MPAIEAACSGLALVLPEIPSFLEIPELAAGALFYPSGDVDGGARPARGAARRAAGRSAAGGPHPAARAGRALCARGRRSPHRHCTGGCRRRSLTDEGARVGPILPAMRPRTMIGLGLHSPRHGGESAARGDDSLGDEHDERRAGDRGRRPRAARDTRTLGLRRRPPPLLRAALDRQPQRLPPELREHHARLPLDGDQATALLRRDLHRPARHPALRRRCAELPADPRARPDPLPVLPGVDDQGGALDLDPRGNDPQDAVPADHRAALGLADLDDDDDDQPGRGLCRCSSPSASIRPGSGC